MHTDTGLLAVVGSLCLMLALVLAWCLAGVRSSLMMTGLLFVFFLHVEHLRRTPPTAIVVAMSLGSVGHPHEALAIDQIAAQTSSQAIRDVVHALRSGAPLEKS